MASRDILYLASSSASRQQLLREAKIPFTPIGHTSPETMQQQALSNVDYVLAIARDKMNSIALPSDHPSSFLVLTADSLVYGETSKTFFGKPGTIEQARTMMRSVRTQVVQVITGCCLVRKNAHEEVGRQEWVTVSRIEFCVPEELLEIYFKECPHAVHSAGGGILEGFGAQFLKSIEGSYSGALGLPLFELQQALHALDFNG